MIFLEVKGIKLSEIDHTELLELNRQVTEFKKFLEGEYENVKKMEEDRS